MDFSITEYFSHRLERLKQNINILEKSLSETEDQYVEDNRDAADLAKKEGLSECQQISVDFFSDDVSLFYESRQHYRCASFLLLYAFLEDSLSKICELIKSKFKYTLSSDDLNGSGVMKFKNYFEKVACINIEEKIWSQIDEYRLIRNHIAHEFGEIYPEENKKKISHIVARHPHLYLEDWGYVTHIRMESEFLHQVISNFKSLISEIDRKTTESSEIRIVK
jgi:hypothetical protein